MLQRTHDANGAVAAHAEVCSIVEEDHTCRGTWIHRWREQRTDNRIVTAGLTYHGAAQMIESRAHILATLSHGGSAGLRPTIQHDASRFTLGVRVDYVNRRRKLWRRRFRQGVHLRGGVSLGHGFTWTVLISV
jgi:hypothetical protein